MAELKLERAPGKCQLCGFEGEINRLSRPMKGYGAFLKDKVFTFKRMGVQEICDSCLLKGLENLLDVSDAHSKARLLKKLRQMLEKHRYKLERVPREGA